MPSTPDPTSSPSQEVDLDVCGTLPSALAGRLTVVGPHGGIHSLHLRQGRVSYLVRSHPAGGTIKDLVAYEGSILAVSETAVVHDLRTIADPPRSVDLAGPGRTLVAGPRYDPATGELHLVALDRDGEQWHVMVGAGALIRRSRSIGSARSAIRGLALGTDHVVFVADGAVGVTPRDHDARISWITSDAPASRPVHAFRRGDGAVLLALTPSLEEWSLQPSRGAVERKVLNSTEQRFARTSENGPDGSPRCIWTTSGRTISRHDTVNAGSTTVCLAPYEPGDFVVVPDSARIGTVGDGWFIGLVYGPTGGTTDLQVIDAADLAGPAVATVRFPQPTARGLRCEWLPAAPQ